MVRSKSGGVLCFVAAAALAALSVLWPTRDDSASAANPRPAARASRTRSAPTMKSGMEAPDFPPGIFIPGGRYGLSDFKGKALVLFFFDNDYLHDDAAFARWNDMVREMGNKPVKFIAVGVSHLAREAAAYARTVNLQSPLFVDTFQAMSSRYGEGDAEAHWVWSFRIVGPDGKVVRSSSELTADEVEKAIEGIGWKYKDSGYDPRLNPAIELLEWNQWEAGMGKLRPMLKTYPKATAESARKLYEEVKKEGAQWKSDAEAALESNPVAAYDLYARVANCFAGDDLAKGVEQPLKQLKGTKAVKDELTARGLWEQLSVAVGRASISDRLRLAGAAEGIAARCPNTPTGERAVIFAKHLREMNGPVRVGD